MDIGEIYGLLRQLGLSAGSSRFFHVSYAVYLAVQQPYRVRFAEWLLYPMVAQRYHTCSLDVKCSICLAVDFVWERERVALSAIAKYPMGRNPCPAEFVGILAAWLRNGYAA